MSWFDPFSEFERIHDEMNRAMQKMFKGGENMIGYKDSGTLLPENYRAPLCDVYEKDGKIVTKLEIPGVDKKDINVNVTDENVEIKVEKTQESEVKKKGMYRCERSYSGFYRAIPLPAKVKSTEANAEYKDGVLTVIAPKIEQIESKKRRLEIR